VKIHRDLRHFQNALEYRRRCCCTLYRQIVVAQRLAFISGDSYFERGLSLLSLFLSPDIDSVSQRINRKSATGLLGVVVDV